jgi:hypothetical protein
VNVIVVTHHVYLPPHSRNAIARRVGNAFARLDQGINQLKVHLKDVYGPRGGNGKVCTVRAELVGGGCVVVTEYATTARHALRCCMERARAAVAEELRRQRPRRTPVARHIPELHDILGAHHDHRQS